MKNEISTIDDVILFIIPYIQIWLLALSFLSRATTDPIELFFLGIIFPGSVILTSIMLLPIIQGFVLLGMLIYDIFKSK